MIFLRAQKRQRIYPLCATSLITLLSACNTQLTPAGLSASPSLNCSKSSILRAKQGGDYLRTLSSSAPLKKLQNHLSSNLSALSDEGRVDGDTPLSVSIALSLNHETELNQLLHDLYDPLSPNYHHFLSSNEFLERYAPTQNQVNQVKDFLISHHVPALSVSDNRLLIQTQGRASSFNSLFYTEIHHYQDSEKHLYQSPAYELQVPTGLPIQAVHGLENTLHFRSYAHTLRSNSTAGITPGILQSAYRIPQKPQGSQGRGQTLALFELDGFTSSDIQTYASSFGLTFTPLQTILVNGATGRPGSGAGEVTLDIELMMAVAPDAKKILVYEGTNDEQGVLGAYNKIASDNLANIVSTSWGMAEGELPSSVLQTENSIFKQMAAQGQALFAASGDSGAYDDKNKLIVNDPASQPYVVGVGGTRLTTQSDGTYGHESTWNSNYNGTETGGGGGISTAWTIPSWQKGVVTPASLGSTQMRNVPDISLNADPQTGYAIYYNGSWVTFGGTSCAAPIWAAFMALVNQQRELNSLAPLGFPNAAIYQIGESNQYLSTFFDIADGSTNRYYPAVKGYDNATGWGSFNGENLLQVLSQDLVSSPSLPPTPAPTTNPAQITGNSQTTVPECLTQ